MIIQSAKLRGAGCSHAEECFFLFQFNRSCGKIFPCLSQTAEASALKDYALFDNNSNCYWLKIYATTDIFAPLGKLPAIGGFAAPLYKANSILLCYPDHMKIDDSNVFQELPLLQNYPKMCIRSVKVRTDTIVIPSEIILSKFPIILVSASNGIQVMS